MKKTLTFRAGHREFPSSVNYTAESTTAGDASFEVDCSLDGDVSCFGHGGNSRGRSGGNDNRQFV